MHHHPILIERRAADRRQTLLQAAEASRSVRAARTPKPRRRWVSWAEHPVPVTGSVALAH